MLEGNPIPDVDWILMVSICNYHERRTILIVFGRAANVQIQVVNFEQTKVDLFLLWFKTTTRIREGE